MLKPWLRLWDKLLDCHKAQSLSGETFKGWINLLSLANRQSERGILPDIDGIAFALRLKREKAQKLVDDLIKATLIDRDGKRYQMHDWEEWQRDYDSSTKRTQDYRHRKRDSDAQRYGDVTSQERHGDVTLACAGAELEKELETEPPVPPVAFLGPEYAIVARYAEEQGGDVSWALWSDRMGRASHPAKSIRAAIDEAAGAGKLTQPYVASILRRWANDGPPGEKNGFGHHRRPEPPQKFHRKGDPL